MTSLIIFIESSSEISVHTTLFEIALLAMGQRREFSIEDYLLPASTWGCMIHSLHPTLGQASAMEMLPRLMVHPHTNIFQFRCAESIYENPKNPKTLQYFLDTTKTDLELICSFSVHLSLLT